MPSIYILIPQTERAKDWIKEHIDPDAMTFGKGIVIEHRYISDILNAIKEEGMTSKDFEVVC